MTDTLEIKVTILHQEIIIDFHRTDLILMDDMEMPDGTMITDMDTKDTEAHTILRQAQWNTEDDILERANILSPFQTSRLNFQT